MTVVHPMTIEAENGDGVLFSCPVETCGRKVVVSRAGGITVVQRGDFFALHSGNSAGFDIAATVTSEHADGRN